MSKKKDDYFEFY